MSKFIVTALEFEQLRYIAIPYGDMLYHIFDLDAKEFLNKIDLNAKKITDYEYRGSDFLIIDELFDYSILTTPNRNLYFVSKNCMLLFAYMTMLELTDDKYIFLFEDLSNLQNYLHNEPSVSFPRNIVANSYEKERAELLLKNEHLYRVASNGSNGSNVTLSIGLLSYNNGHFALEAVNSFLKNIYDCEIELFVLDNGSTEDSQEYEQIKNISDIRVKYFKFNEKQPNLICFNQLANVVSGKFLCLLMDGFIIMNDSLEHYLSILKDNSDLSVVFSQNSTVAPYSAQFFEKGHKALYAMAFQDNYVSGLIYNTKAFNELQIRKISEDWLSSCNIAAIQYPISCWTILMCNYSRTYKDNLTLVMEIKSDKQNRKVASDNSYMQYDSRLGQHIGFTNIIKHLKSSQAVPSDTISKLYLNLCRRTAFLLNLNSNLYSVTKEEIRKDAMEYFLQGENVLKTTHGSGTYYSIVHELIK